MRPSAFLVGVSTCKSGGAPLYGTFNDVTAMSGWLQSFDEVILRNASATKAEFLQRLVQYRTDVASEGNGTGEGAKLLLYFAGHGTTFRVMDPTSLGVTEHQGLCLSDFELGVDATALSDEELAQHLRAFPPKTEITVILDCCYSGGVAPELEGLSLLRRIVQRLGLLKLSSRRRARYIPHKPWKGRIGEAAAIRRIGFARALLSAPEPPAVAPNLVLFAACQAGQQAYEKPYRVEGVEDYSGVFTRNLSEVLSTRVTSGSTNKDVYDAVSESMAAAAANQEPLLYPDDSTRTFPR